MSDPLGLFEDEGQHDPLGLFGPAKEKASLGTAAASSFAGLGNTFDTAGSMLLGAGKSLFGNTEGADETYRASEERNKTRSQWANPDNQELTFGGKLLGAPAGLVSFPLAPFETGKGMVDNGESLGTALGGVGIATAGNAAGMLIPGALGAGALAKIGTGAAINAAQTYAQQQALSALSDTEAGKKQFAPNLEDVGVAAVIGGGFGGLHSLGNRGSEPTAVRPTEEVSRLNPDEVAQRIDAIAPKEDPLGLFAGEKEQTRVPNETPLPEINEAIPPEVSRLPEENTPFPSIPESSLDIDPNTVRIPGTDTPLPRLLGTEQAQPGIPELFKATRERKATNADMPSRIAAKLEADGIKQTTKELPKINDKSFPEIELNREAFGPGEINANETAIPSSLVDPSYGGINADHLLEHFANNSIDPGYQSLAAALKGKLGDVDVAVSMKDGVPQDFHTNSSGSKVRGTYSTSDLIMLGKKGMTDRVFLHEAIHAATAKFLRAFPEAEGTVALNKLYQDMLPKAQEAGFLTKNEAGKFADERGYGFHNVDEFVAEAMTNRGLQDWLKTHTITGELYVPQSKLTSAWESFKQIIGKMFGMDSQAYTALDHVMSIASDIIDTNNTYRDAVKEGYAQWANKVVGKAALNNLDAPTERIQSTNDVNEATNKAVTNLTGIIPTYKVDIAGNLENYREEKDISNPNNSFKSGTQFTSLLNNKNALVRDVGRVFNTALNEGRALEARMLTNKTNGVLALSRKLSKNEFTDLQMVLRTAEGKTDLSPEQMRTLGLNDKQIAVASKMRAVLDDTLTQINSVLRSRGQPEISRRAGYLPGTFKGDFRTIVTDKEGKFVSVISDNNRRTMQKIVSDMKSKNPDYNFEISDKAVQAAGTDQNSFAAFEQALALVGDTSPDAQRIQSMYQDYKTQSAFNSGSMKKHFMEKRGGMTGAEGFKAWKSDAENAKEGFKAFNEYVETANKWAAVNKGVDEVKVAMTDPAIIKAQPNAVSYLNKYINTITGKSNAEFLYGIPKAMEDVVQGIFNMAADATGYGPTTLKAPFNEMAKYTQLAWMGMRPGFSMVQMLQYSATLPKKFADFSPLNVIRSELTGMHSAAKMLLQLNKSIRMGKKGVEVDGSSINNPFDRDMYRYMVDTGLINQSVLLDVKSLDQPAWLTKAQDVASINMRIPEVLTRVASFATFAQNYKNLGLSNRVAFEKAMDASNFTMGNYHPEERPLLYQQGWATQKLGALQTYKHNQIGQIRSYFQDAKSGKPTGLALYTLTTLAMGGIIGLPAMEQADELADKLGTMLFKKPFSVKRWLMTNVPEIYTRGAVSNLTRNIVPEGVDLGSSMSAADLLGTGAEGYITDNIKKAQALAKLVTADTSTERAQAARDLVPMQFKGTIENNYLSKPLYEKDQFGNLQETGNRLTANPNTLEGDVVRTPMEQTLRSMGATSINERQTKDLNYASQREETEKTKLRADAINSLGQLYYSGKLTSNMDPSSLDVYKKAYQQYFNNGGDPNAFEKAIVQEAMNQQKTALQRNIGNPKNIRSIDKAQTYLQGR